MLALITSVVMARAFAETPWLMLPFVFAWISFSTYAGTTRKLGVGLLVIQIVCLRELLRANHRYIFTLIQKFQTSDLLCDRPDVIVLTDEAHRSQYDTLALNMRASLPKAMFVAFTGTPLIAGEERTKDVFGDYVSIYDFQQSVEDGATVPLVYENRTPELQLVNPDLNEDLYYLIEAAELDSDQEAKLERELSRRYHILTRDDRLETIAQDIVRHFLGRGFIGKAMVRCGVMKRAPGSNTDSTLFANPLVSVRL
jgi:type I site-specific restriction-modification system R (restriction) subunit